MSILPLCIVLWSLILKPTWPLAYTHSSVVIRNWHKSAHSLNCMRSARSWTGFASVFRSEKITTEDPYFNCAPSLSHLMCHWFHESLLVMQYATSEPRTSNLSAAGQPQTRNLLITGWALHNIRQPVSLKPETLWSLD